MSDHKKNLEQRCPIILSWEDTVEGQPLRIGWDTPAPKQFVRDGDLMYSWKRLIYRLESGLVHLDHRQTSKTIDGVLLFGQPLIQGSPLERYNPFNMAALERLNLIDEAYYQHVKVTGSEDLRDVYVFRAGDTWYSDYTEYQKTGGASAFSTAQDAADALADRTRCPWPDPSEIEKKAVEMRLEAERAAEESRLKQRAAEELEERRQAENAEIAALEEQLKDIERKKYLRELRVKVAQAKENGDV